MSCESVLHIFLPLNNKHLFPIDWEITIIVAEKIGVLWIGRHPGMGVVFEIKTSVGKQFSFDGCSSLRANVSKYWTIFSKRSIHLPNECLIGVDIFIMIGRSALAITKLFIGTPFQLLIAVKAFFFLCSHFINVYRCLYTFIKRLMFHPRINFILSIHFNLSYF